MAYIRTTWQDSPSTATPINATRLNNIETGTYNNDVNKINIADINNTLTSTSIIVPLSAAQGKVLNDGKQSNLGLTSIATGLVTDATNGVNINCVTSGFGLYLVLSTAWVAATGGKAGMSMCSSVAGGMNYVDNILTGTFAGKVTMSSNVINIKPYNTDGCMYNVIKIV